MRATIVLDLGGTLIDSAPKTLGIAIRLLAARNLDPIDLDTTRRFIGKGAPAFITQLRAARGIAPSEQTQFVKDFVAHFEEAVDLTDPYPDVEQALSRLAARHRLGIFSNKPYRPCITVLEHLKLARFFSAVLGGDSRPVGKPYPFRLLATFDQMEPGQRLFVGDSETDAETAARAGVPFVLLTRGYRKSPIEELLHVAAFEEVETLLGMSDTSLGTWSIRRAVVALKGPSLGPPLQT